MAWTPAPLLLMIASACFIPGRAAASGPKAVPPYQGPLSAEGIAGYIRDNGIRDAGELIPLLPESLRGRFTLIRESRSSQRGCVSPERPRVLMFAPGFIMSFTSDPGGDDPRCRGIEIIETRGDRLVPSEIVFDSLKSRKPGATLHADPTRCASCHSANTRPIWGTYPFWIGAYGENDDKLSKEELRLFEKNRARWKSTPPYSGLIWDRPIVLDEAGRKDFARRNLGKSPEEAYPVKARPYSLRERGEFFELRPNLALNKVVASMNQTRLAGMLKRSPRYPEARLQALSLLLNCAKGPALEAASQALTGLGFTGDDLDLRLPEDRDATPEGELPASAWSDGYSSAKARLLEALLYDLSKDLSASARRKAPFRVAWYNRDDHPLAYESYPPVSLTAETDAVCRWLGRQPKLPRHKSCADCARDKTAPLIRPLDMELLGE